MNEASPNATDETRYFPMPVDTFLAGDHLSRADVILMRGNSLFGRGIRFATRSPFSHAALVFLVPHREAGFEQTFLIEAVTSGVSISSLAEVVATGSKGPSQTAVAVLRLNRPWFTGDVPATVRGRMLDFIKSGYDWRTVLSLAMAVAKGMIWAHDDYSRSVRASLRSAYCRHGLAPANFICSGLVQYGFLSTLHKLAAVPDAPVPSDEVKSAIFNPRLNTLEPETILKSSADALADLLATTPDDISRAPQMQWKYLLLNGTAHSVTSRDEAVTLLAKS